MPKAKGNKKSKPKEGRPTKYNKAYSDQAYRLCLVGLTDEELAKFFEVSEATINNWKLNHPEFLESIKRGKSVADANVADRLYQRAMGFEHDSEEIKILFDNSTKEQIIERVPIRKVYAPDTAAAIFWLKNRQKKHWRDKIDHGLTDSDGNDVSPINFYLPDNGRK